MGLFSRFWAVRRETCHADRDAGLEPEELLQAMVRAPLDLDAPADLIALHRSPLDDPTAFDDLRLVVRAGNVVRDV